MLLVGGGAAVIAIAVYFAWLFVHNIRASIRARRAAKSMAGAGRQDVLLHLQEVQEHVH